MTSLAVSPARNKPDRSDDKAKALRLTIDESIDCLAKAVDEVRASDTFKAFLDVQAKFHRYSWHNSLLILSQKPTASRVAGFQTWKKLGRHVNKGERGIAIFAPCPWKREETNDKGESETKQGIFFRVVHVFDVAQTDGAELPSVEVPNVQAAADKLLSDLAAVAGKRNIALTFGKIAGGAYGLSKRGAVEVDNSYSTGQQAKTLAHELAHEALHWEDRGPLTRSIAELEAESVAYVVCRHFGLDVEVRASRYIALWQGDSKSLRDRLERIAKTARELIDDCENAADVAGESSIEKAVAA